MSSVDWLLAVWTEPDRLGLLIRAGADVNIRSSDGRTPAHDAAASKNSATPMDESAQSAPLTTASNATRVSGSLWMW